MITVKQLLKTKGNQVWSVSPGDSIRLAIQMMSEKEIGAVLVLENGKVAGIFSERDYTRLSISAGGCSLNDPVSKMMTRSVFVVTPETTLEECMALMTQKRFRHLPVVEHGEVVGVISIGDVVKELITEMHFTIQGLEDYIIREDRDT